MKAFKAYDFGPRAMTSLQTIAELLQNSLEVSRLTQDPSTYRGRRTSIDLLQRALRRAGYLTMDELEATNLSVAHFIQALQEEIQANEEGKAYSTLSQVLSQICRILEEIGASLTTTTMLRNSKQRIIESVDPVRHQQETISQTQMMDVLLMLQGLEDDDSSTTERVYQDINAKQQRASLAMAGLLTTSWASRNN